MFICFLNESRCQKEYLTLIDILKICTFKIIYVLTDPVFISNSNKDIINEFSIIYDLLI